MLKLRRNLILSIFLIIFMISNVIFIYGAQDNSILSEDIDEEYYSRKIGRNIIDNINFSDVNSSHWAKEPITRLGALEVLKGYSDGLYRPNKNVSKEEAIAMIIRIIGMEEEAVKAAEQISINNPYDEGLTGLWAKGHLQVARDIGLITDEDYNSALIVDQSTLNSEYNFIRKDEVTREQIAKWLVEGINYINPNDIEPNYNPQAILSFEDMEDIGIEFAPYVEAIVRNDIMEGYQNHFNPKDSLTRAELAQIIVNIDDILYNTMNLEKKEGTIGYIQNEFDSEGSQVKIYVRNNLGLVDVLLYSDETDTPVLMNGRTYGMSALDEEQVIDYVVNKETNELLYVYLQGDQETRNVVGNLQPLTQLEEGKVTVQNNEGNHTYLMTPSLYKVDENEIKINNSYYKINEAPISHQVTLTLLGDIVTNILYTGDPVMYNEISGIVKENNTTFSYITITDWNGNEITKKYLKNAVEVEKQNYYDEADEIGHIDEMFPNFNFDERDSTIYDIEPGDLVHLRLDAGDSSYVTMISGKTNYVVKYATVKELSYYGGNGTNIVVEYDDGSITEFSLDPTTPVMKRDINVGTLELQAGDVVKMLINQAVLNPGTLKETVKELVIDEYGNKVYGVYKGKFGTINDVQRSLSLLNVYSLESNGWYNYQTGKVLDISANDIEYFNEGRQISLDYAKRYLNSDNYEVYVVTSNDYGYEKVEKVTFRNGRDSVLDYSTISYTNGLDYIKLLNNSKNVGIDEGTIVIKNGKLVESSSVMAPDYVQVILNGSNAAIVNVEQEPNNDALSIFRGRIAKIDEYQSFQVQSHAVLKDMEWIYSPIPRIFNLSYNTKIYDENGIIPFDEFISYTDISKVDEVYTIIAEGTTANVIVKNPYAKEGVKGQIVDINDTEIMLKDVLSYSSDDEKWSELSYRNNYAIMNVIENSIVIKNNNIVDLEDIRIGDTIKVLTTEVLAEKFQETGDRSFDGYIIFVEN